MVVSPAMKRLNERRLDSGALMSVIPTPRNKSGAIGGNSAADHICRRFITIIYYCNTIILLGRDGHREAVQLGRASDLAGQPRMGLHRQRHVEHVDFGFG